MAENSENKVIENAEGKRSTIISNFIWRFAERCGAQGVTFIVSIVLARLLDPAVYGTLALITLITNVLTVFVESSFGNALIQKKDADELDFSTVFYTNMTVCGILYVGMFFASPKIAAFYEMPEITPMIRVISLTLIIAGIKNIQQAYVSRTMQFKKFFFSTLGGTIGAAVVGIVMAFMGFGVWALIAQSLLNATVDTLILWFTVKWRPKLMFSFERLKGLFSYGWKLLAASVINQIFQSLYQFIIGKMYSEEDLAQYNKADQFPNIIITNINASLTSILMPAMAAQQDDRSRVKLMTRYSIKMSTYVMAPLLMGLAFVGKPLVGFLLTDKWLPCVPFMQVFCVSYMFYPIHTANLSAIKALGRSDLFLKLEILKKVFEIVMILIFARYGVMAIALSALATDVAAQIINSWPNRKLLGYGYMEQLKDIMPGILLAVVMGCIIYPIQFIGLPNIVTLLIQVPLGAIIYIGGSRLFKLESFTALWGMVGPRVSKYLPGKK